MLLFFIAQMLAWGGNTSCKSQNHNTRKKFDVYICDNIKSVDVHAQNAVNYWSNLGWDINMATRPGDCDSRYRQGAIYLVFDDYEVNRENTETFTAKGVTEITNFGQTNDIRMSTIFIATWLTQSDLERLVFHEIGHSLGYQHISHECYGYVMNPINSKAGFKF